MKREDVHRAHALLQRIKEFEQMQTTIRVTNYIPELTLGSNRSGGWLVLTRGEVQSFLEKRIDDMQQEAREMGVKI